MKQKWMAVIVAAMLLLAVVQVQAEPAVPEDAYASATQKAQVLVNQYGAASVQYALMEKGRILTSGSAGAFGEELYAIGSVSKVFTAAAAMKLVEDGKLDLDRPVTEYLPDFTMADARYAQITTRMLLNHTSGLPGGSFQNAFLFDDGDPQAHDTFLQNLAAMRLKADPGAYASYCNDGFLLAELVIERVSGQDFTAFLHENFLRPLDMTRTFTPRDDFDRGEVAAIYSAVDPALELPVDTLNIIGTGGIYSTAEDMCRFGQLFTSEAGLLSPASLQAMANPEYKNGFYAQSEHNTVGFGLGWDSVNLYPYDLFGVQALSKGGDTNYMHAAFTVLPEYGLTAVALSSGGMSPYNQAIVDDLLLTRLVELGAIEEIPAVERWQTPTASQPLQEDLSAYEGYYGNTALLYDVSFLEDGSLLLATALAPDQAMVFLHDGGGAFFLDSPASQQKLTIEEHEGNVYLKVEVKNFFDGLGATIGTDFLAQKLPENAVPADAVAAWEAREGKSYFAVAEKYTSEILYPALPVAGVGGASTGYLATNAITGPDEARFVVKAPGNAGRDQVDYTFFTEDGVEYMRGAAHVYVSQDALTPLEEGKSKIIIPPSGYAQWQTIAPELAGKRLAYESPEQSAVVIYDAAGVCRAHSLLTGEGPYDLPQGGYIAYVGDPGAAFNLTVE